MGTHPIFESDFDCLTEFLIMGGKQSVADRQPEISFLREMFDEMDPNDDGKITKKELKAMFLKRLEDSGDLDEVQDQLVRLKIAEVVKDAFTEGDANGDGVLSWSEFKAAQLFA